jgi:hypothetical protein
LNLFLLKPLHFRQLPKFPSKGLYTLDKPFFIKPNNQNSIQNNSK